MKKRKILKKIISSTTALAIIFSGTFASFVPGTVKSANAKQKTEINEYGILTKCKTNGTLYISKNIYAIAPNALDKAKITKFVVDSQNPSFKAIDGILYTKNGNRLVRFPNNRSKSYTIPSDVKTISQYAFRNSDKLKEITIPNTVSNIGEGAFYGCSSLKKITIPQKITTIRPFTFFNCSSIKNIKLPANLEQLGCSSFMNCKKLETANIPNGITQIGQNTFMGCENLKKVKFPSSLDTIKSQAFKNCNSLTSIKLPNNLDDIENSAFYSCNALKSITLGKGITAIKYGTFSNCTSLKSITIPENVESISSNAFENSIENFKVSAGNSTFSAKNGVLYNKAQTVIKKFPCLKSGSYTMPDTVKSITYGAFFNCKSLKNLTLSDKITALDLSSFKNSGINRLNLSKNLEGVYGSSSNLKYLKKITIPDSNKRFFVNDDILYCYYNLENYMTSNSASNWGDNETAPNFSILIYPIAKQGTVTILSQTVYPSEIPYENQASYFKTASVTSGAAFCSDENGVLTNTEKNAISVIPGKISNCYIGSKIKNLSYITNYKAYLTGLKKYTVSNKNKYYTTKDGVLYNKLLTKLIDYPSKKTGSYKFPKTVVSVNYTAFKNAVKLKELALSKNITSCKNISLENCKSLTKFTIPENSSVRKLLLQFNNNVAPKLISVPTSLISFKMYGVSDKMHKLTTIKGFTNTCAEKAAKMHKLNFVSKGIVPKALKHIKIKAYINDRYLKVSWTKSKDASGYEIYTDNNITKKIKNNKITTANIYIGKSNSTILYIRAYNLVKGKKLYSKARKRYVYLND